MSIKCRALFGVCLLLVLICLSLAAHADIVISEIMTDSGEFDNNGNAYDWIELYNNGSKAADLSGWGLTDSKSDPYAFRFPEGTVLKGSEYALVYCCGDDQNADRPFSKTYYAHFKLGTNGETIRLRDKSGKEVQALKYPAQYNGFSWGLADGKNDYGFFAAATPRKKNSSKVYSTQADKPVIETAAGFYSKAVQVKISSSQPVRYTLDGSEPTEKSKLYSSPLDVTKTTVVRAKAFPNDQLPSYTVTASYIISDPAITPVVSLSTGRDYLYGNKGLFVKGNNGTPNYNTDWEYPMHVEYFDMNGVRQMNEFCSFHIVGTSSRAQKQKSFSVYPRTAYGSENHFSYNPFADRDYEEYHALTIRSTGSDAAYCRMRDLVLTRLANGLDIMYLAGQTVIVYINGEYQGQFNIREKVNKYSIAQWEGVTDKDLIDNIDIIKGEARDDLIQRGSADDWRELRAYVKSHDLNVPENLKYVTDRLDVDSLFTWTCFELCILNTDMENVRVYRVPGGKWKYILYDVESGGELRDLAVYMLLDSSKAGKVLSSQYSLIKNLLLVPQMRARFLQRLAEVIEHSFLYTESVKPEIERNEALLQQLLPRHFTVYRNNNMGEWRQNVKSFKRAMRMIPRRMLKLVFESLNVTSAEQQRYFKRVQELLTVTNAEGVE
ncbi:MAG: CotH kinase family protein [Clostridia bacterium]|nr:CotH kinase family protein [Clostridia bacterium]